MLCGVCVGCVERGEYVVCCVECVWDVWRGGSTWCAVWSVCGMCGEGGVAAGLGGGGAIEADRVCGLVLAWPPIRQGVKGAGVLHGTPPAFMAPPPPPPFLPQHWTPGVLHGTPPASHTAHDVLLFTALTPLITSPSW